MKSIYTISEICSVNKPDQRITAYISSKCAFLFDTSSGRSMLVDKNQWNCIKSGNIDRDIMFIMMQRGFLDHVSNESLLFRVLPSFFLINMTDTCNLHCRYCFRDVHNIEKPAITKQEIIRIGSAIVDICKRYNINGIHIQPWGGEPLIAYDKIIALDDFLGKCDISYRMVFTTNATLINESMATEFKNRDFHIGVSLDGNEEIHNFQRPAKGINQNSYELAKRGVLLLKKVGFEDIGYICTITKYNVSRVDDILSNFVTVFKAHSIKLNFVKINPFSYESEELAVLDDSVIDTFYDNLIDIIISYNENGYYIFERNIADKLHNLLSLNYSNICNSTGCLGGRKMISFDRTGNVFPCELVDVDHVRICNAFETDVITSIQSAIDKNPFFSSREEQKCQSCNWRVYCRGGCAASIIYNSHQQSKCDELECTINRMLYPKLIGLILNKPNSIEYLSGKQIRID